MRFSRHQKSRLPTKTKTQTRGVERHTAIFSVMSEESANDKCRLCEVSFKVQFGSLRKQSHSSSENLFKSSKRKECFGVVLSEICRQVGLPLTQESSKYSDRVCNPCGCKIRNLGRLYQFVQRAATATTSTPVKTSKRTLDMLEKASPPWRKSKSVRINSPVGKTPFREVSPAKSRKSLAFAGKNIENTSSASLERENEMLCKLNVENLPSDGVKILYLNQLGNVTVRNPRESQTKTLVKNIAAKKWRKVSNGILKHVEIMPELFKGICKLVSKEFDEYTKSECMLDA